jgi:type IV pilus assembly protein PilN
MVRINLLPDRRPTKTRVAATEPGQLWLLVVMGLMVLEIVALLFVQKWKQDEYAKVQGDNIATQAKIDDLKNKIKDQAQVKAQLQELKDRQAAIQKLESGRTGPTAVLEEISHILTAGRGPTTDKDKLEQLRHENPQAVLNANWDPRRLWLTSYQEIERAVKIGGIAKDSEDVSEFERRLILSDYFYDVNLLPGGKFTDNVTKTELVRFEMSAKVRY